MERWVSVPGHQGLYEVSSMGRLRSLWFKTPRVIVRKQYDKDGYEKVVLSRNGRKFNTRMHRVVALAFLGPPPDGHECCHLDGNPRNNKLSNLRWVTPKENCRHKSEHGTQVRGSRVGNSKLTEKMVLRILALLHAGHSCSVIARRFAVCRENIRAIKTGRSWAWLTGIGQ